MKKNKAVLMKKGENADQQSIMQNECNDISTPHAVCSLNPLPC